MTSSFSNALDLIKHLGLTEHVEGGYFSETYRSDKTYDTAQGDRSTMTSIYYLLTDGASIGHFHLNQSDIMHYFHSGDPIDYYLLEKNGQLSKITLGPDLQSGQQFQLMVPGGVWKASQLNKGPVGYGLIGEAVAPGFEFDDMTLGDYQTMLAKFPHHRELLNQLFEQ